DGIRDYKVTGVQTCALPISLGSFTVDGNYGLCVEHAFLAMDARRADGASAIPTGDLEEIEVFTVSLREALAMLPRGDVAQLSSRSEERRVGKEGRCGLAACW